MQIKSYIEAVSWQGDSEDPNIEHEEGATETSEDVADAILFLRGKGPLEPSSSTFEDRLWYTGPVAEDDDYFRKGISRSTSYHPEGFTHEQLRTIYKAVKDDKFVPSFEEAFGDRIEVTARALAATAAALGHGPQLRDELAAVKAALDSQSAVHTLDAADKLYDALGEVGVSMRTVKTGHPLFKPMSDILDILDRADRLGIYRDVPEPAASLGMGR